MKKSVLISFAIIISTGLMALSYLSKPIDSEAHSATKESSIIKFEKSFTSQIGIKKKPAFFFDMGPRFRPVKKSFIDRVKNVEEFLSENEYKNIDSYESIEIVLFEEEKRSDKYVKSEDPKFNEEQLKFLRAMNYSTNFVIQADFQERVANSGESYQLNWNYATPHLTVVPEKQAEYKLGNGAFYEFLREKAKKEIDAVDYDKLFPAKLYFTISKEGQVTNLQLKKSSLHPELDKKMIELIQELPGEWEAAEDQAGNKVDQELVLSFGLVGC